MPSHMHGDRGDRSTKMDKLLSILADGEYHSTQELSRRVGHTFAVAKFKLVHAGHAIEREPHPTKRHQWRYRLRRAPHND